MRMTTGLAGKTAVVTGTAHGIGAAIAEALRGDGAAVHGVDKDTADLTSADAVRELGAGRARPLAGPRGGRGRRGRRGAALRPPRAPTPARADSDCPSSP